MFGFVKQPKVMRWGRSTSDMRRSVSQIATDVLTKIAVQYDEYGNIVSPSFPWVHTGLGATLGGLGAQFVFPSEETKAFRELAKKVPEGTDVWQKVKTNIGKNKVVSFKGPPDIVRKFYRNQALRANALRMVGGVGAGAATGYLLSRLLGED